MDVGCLSAPFVPPSPCSSGTLRPPSRGLSPCAQPFFLLARLLQRDIGKSAFFESIASPGEIGVHRSTSASTTCARPGSITTAT